MKSMNEVYNKIKKEYPQLKVKLDENKTITERFQDPHSIVIKDQEKEIIACEEVVELLYKGENITHSHPEDYDDIYDSIKYYLKEEPEKIKKSIKKAYWLQMIVLIIGFLILLVIKELLTK